MNLQDLKLNSSLNSTVLNIYGPLAEAQKTFLSQKVLEQQFLSLLSSQSYILPKDQLIMQSRINSLNTYLRNARNLLSTAKCPRPAVLQIQKATSLDSEHLKLRNQDSKLSIETADSDSQRSDITYRERDHNDRKVLNSLKKTDKDNLEQQNFDSKKRRNYWLPHEDQMLTNLIELHGLKWTKIASCLQNRTGKQVRDRYLNYLKPSIKQKAWTADEDELLEKLYLEFGNKWSKIANELQGRTENQVKNRYYSGIRKGKPIKKLKASEQPLRAVKIEFEHSLIFNLMDETVTSLQHLQEVKNEEFETCELASQYLTEKPGKTRESVQRVQNLDKTISGSKRSSPYVYDDQLSKKHQTNIIQSFKETFVKIENLNAESTIYVKEETL